MECHSPQMTSVLEENMAPSYELKENGVGPLVTGPTEVAYKGSLEVDTVSGDIVALLISLPPIVDWIMPKVNEIQQFMRISHGGCEDQFKELITAIEASHVLETKSSFKKSRELHRLFLGINYDAKGGSSSRGKSKGRAL
ncbi:hypothetical protein F2P56_031397 [Juglans regia]|uniref:Uncharacterized protein LOC108985071 n=2 Tax=Juglans regia TaxID=51240 RepID=A0A2I4E046_JUGRE|nr:uncharacterized protein LOC108985071 [Juglans regia]KAF5451101.1 hypothetical protein F2P56_031397 [Juglans regia]